MCEAEFDICVMTCASMRNENHLSVVDLGLSDTVSSICRTFHSISTNLLYCIQFLTAVLYPIPDEQTDKHTRWIDCLVRYMCRFLASSCTKINRSLLLSGCYPSIFGSCNNKV